MSVDQKNYSEDKDVNFCGICDSEYPLDQDWNEHCESEAHQLAVDAEAHQLYSQPRD